MEEEQLAETSVSAGSDDEEEPEGLEINLLSSSSTRKVLSFLLHLIQTFGSRNGIFVFFFHIF